MDEVYNNQTGDKSESPEDNSHDAGNQEEGNLDHQWDSEEGKQIHCGESKHCYEQIRTEKFDVEHLFHNKKRCNPRCDGKYFAKICAGEEQHFN